MKSSCPQNPTNLSATQQQDFYNTNFQDYHDRTFFIDPTPILTRLTNCLPKGASILDIGCGSGRDLLWLKMHGYAPTGFERSSNLAQLARENSDCSVMEGDFTVYDFSILQFDALLLIGALVHLHYSELLPILARIQDALILNGLMLLTIKEGANRVSSKNGRVFTLWQPEQLENIFRKLGLLALDFSRNISAINSSDVWLSYLLQKKGIKSNE